MDTDLVNESIVNLSRALDDARISAFELQHTIMKRPGDPMLNPPRHMAIIHSDIEAAIIRLHYVGEILLCNDHSD
jgi:hypothetical protein